jgi:hypothetical protein
MTDDILDRIDAAVGCFTCQGVLAADSPSGDFCSAECQAEWHEGRSAPLQGYWEPWDRPWDFPGVGGESFRPNSPTRAIAAALTNHRSALSYDVASIPTGQWFRVGVAVTPEPVEFRLPPQSSDLLADWRAARRAARAATTPAQVAAVDLRMAALSERSQAAFDLMSSTMAELGRALSANFAAMAEAIAAAWPRASQTLYVNLHTSTDALGGRVEGIAERALAARRNRNTGPERRRRAPRRIDATRTR